MRPSLTGHVSFQGGTLGPARVGHASFLEGHVSFQGGTLGPARVGHASFLNETCVLPGRDISLVLPGWDMHPSLTRHVSFQDGTLGPAQVGLASFLDVTCVLPWWDIGSRPGGTLACITLP